MGRGNVTPGKVEGAKYFYIDKELIYGEDYYNKDINEFNFQFYFDEFINSLIELIGQKWDSFRAVEDSRKVGLRTYAYIICKNSLVNIEMMDNQSSVMLSVSIPEHNDPAVRNKTGLAYKHLNNYYKGIIKIFKDVYDKEFLEGKLRVKTSAWTSGAIDLNKVA